MREEMRLHPPQEPVIEPVGRPPRDKHGDNCKPRIEGEGGETAPLPQLPRGRPLPRAPERRVRSRRFDESSPLPPQWGSGRPLGSWGRGPPRLHVLNNNRNPTSASAKARPRIIHLPCKRRESCAP